MERHRNDVEDLSADDCWDLVGTAGIGRLALVVDGAPEIFPVNYVVDDGTVVFRSGQGTKADRAVAQAPVALEVDGHDPSASKAWSVVLKGSARSVPRGHELFQALELPLFPWQPGVKDRFVRIVPASVTGRRFPVTDPESWNSPAAVGRRTPRGPTRWTTGGPKGSWAPS